MPQNEDIADENCDRVLVAALRAAGFDVIWIREVAPGIGDTEVFEMAASDSRVLITNDHGFGIMAERPVPRRPPAIVLMRLQRLPPVARRTAAVQAVQTLAENLIGHFTVIEPHQIRSHPFRD